MDVAAILSIVGLLSSLASWTLQYEGGFPFGQPPEQVVALDYDRDGDLDLLLVSSLPGETRLLENEAPGTFVEVGQPPGLQKSPGFLFVTPTGGSEPRLVGVEVMDPQGLHVYRLTPQALVEEAYLRLPAEATAPPVPVAPLRFQVPLATGVLEVTLDTAGALQAGARRTLSQPVLTLWVIPSDSGNGTWIYRTPEGWYRWESGTPAWLAAPEAWITPLPLAEVPGAALLLAEPTGQMTLLSTQGVPLQRATVSTPGRYRFWPVWQEGLWGWGTTAEGRAALVRLQPSSLSLDLWYVDSLGDLVGVLPETGAPLPALVFLRHDTLEIYGLRETFPLLSGWRLPWSPVPRLRIHSREADLWFTPVFPLELPFVAVATPDSALWLSPAGAIPLALPRPGTLEPLSPALTSTPSAPQHLWIWPNPTQRHLWVEYRVTEPALVEILLCRSNGQVLRVLDRSVRDAGRYEVFTSLEGLPPGQYLVVYRRGNEVENQKVILVP